MTCHGFAVIPVSERTYGDAENWMWALAALNARRHPNVCRGPFAEARIEGFNIAFSIAFR